MQGASADHEPVGVAADRLGCRAIHAHAVTQLAGAARAPADTGSRPIEAAGVRAARRHLDELRARGNHERYGRVARRAAATESSIRLAAPTPDGARQIDGAAVC